VVVVAGYQRLDNQKAILNKVADAKGIDWGLSIY
jgi:hypothetical protein